MTSAGARLTRESRRTWLRALAGLSAISAFSRYLKIRRNHSHSTPGARCFVRKALVTARLQRPAIVPLYGAGRWPDGVPFHAMRPAKAAAYRPLPLAR